jgi:hypothetical protein
MSEPIINFNNRTLRVEHDGWYLEVKVIASGRQLAVKCAGTDHESNDLIIRPDTANRVFISSKASERESPNEVSTSSGQPEKRDSNRTRTKQ